MVFWHSFIRQNPTFGVWYGRVQRQPNWVTKLAVTVAVITVVLPLLLLTLAAVVLAVAVFIIGSLVAAGMRAVAGLFGGGVSGSRRDGRRNVRVIQRP
jgi:divalent metal cation (Fe/Co/Zn/Cd) transporter